MRRGDVLGVLAGLAGGVVAAGVGVQGVRPVVIGLVVAGVAIWGARRWPEGTHLPWPRRGRRVYSGGSHEVSRLATSIDRHARRAAMPDPRLQQRLRRLAESKLRRADVAWPDPRTRELLGADVHADLIADEFIPNPDRVEAIVEAIERLPDSTAGGVGPRSPGGAG